MKLVYFVSSILLGVLVAGKYRNYRNFTVLKVFPENDDENLKLLSLPEDESDINLWTFPSRFYTTVDLNIPPWLVEDVLEKLRQWNIAYEVRTRNFQEWIDKEQADIVNLRSIGEKVSLDFDRYYNYDEIKQCLLTMQRNHSPYVTLHSIGTTYENREIPLAIVGNFSDYALARQSVVIECGMHAREWISNMACLWILQSVLTEHVELLNNFVFHLLPVVNPDGYAYTWKTDRIWRKNRKPIVTNGEILYGVDINRNFDFFFYGEGSSPSPSENTYRGPYVFSEEESKAVRDYIGKVDKARLVGYFGLHSYGSFWMYPYGRDDTTPTNLEDLKRLGQLAVDEIKRYNGSAYRLGSIRDLLDSSTGSSVEWVKWTTDCRAAYAIEMRGNDAISVPCGFMLPVNEIKDACEEVWLGVRTILAEL